MANIKDMLSGMDTRQKATAGIIAVVVIVLIWQVGGMFGGGSTEVAPAVASAPGVAPAAPPPPPKPQTATLMNQQPAMSPREAELLRLQQETEAKYVAALNELQMLRVEKEIAETNKDIAKAKVETIVSQKNIVDILTPRPAPAPVAAEPQPSSTDARMSSGSMVGGEYSVVSVAQIRYKWTAVLSYNDSLYHVSVGDTVPADGSKVVSIDKSGVTLEKDGESKKVSMVPII